MKREILSPAIRLKYHFLDKVPFIHLIFSQPICRLYMIIFLTINGVSMAQDYKPFDAHLHLKNMHIWRGGVVTPGVMMATSLEYLHPVEKLSVGIWGGAGFDGTYTEYTYYAVYRFNDRLYLEVVSHNNYSGREDYDIFSYDKFTSPNFVDIAIGYTVSGQFPLSVFCATILAGQAGDYELDAAGHATNSYSTYLELKHKFWQDKDMKFHLFAGGAFSFITQKTFYSEKPNIINFGASFSKDITISSKKIPIEASAIWNPETKLGVLQLDISIF